MNTTQLPTDPCVGRVGVGENYGKSKHETQHKFNFYIKTIYSFYITLFYFLSLYPLFFFFDMAPFLRNSTRSNLPPKIPPPPPLIIIGGSLLAGNRRFADVGKSVIPNDTCLADWRVAIFARSLAAAVVTRILSESTKHEALTQTNNCYQIS